jgi:hypothetical protein
MPVALTYVAPNSKLGPWPHQLVQVATAMQSKQEELSEKAEKAGIFTEKTVL